MSSKKEENYQILCVFNKFPDKLLVKFNLEENKHIFDLFKLYSIIILIPR